MSVALITLGLLIGPADAEPTPAQREGYVVEHNVERQDEEARRFHHPRPEVDGWYWTARDVGWPEHAMPWLLAIINCESLGNPHAVGGARERGLTQIHPVHFRWIAERWGITPDDLFDPAHNLVVALDVFAQQGVGAWTCHKRTGARSTMSRVEAQLITESNLAIWRPWKGLTA